MHDSGLNPGVEPACGQIISAAGRRGAATLHRFPGGGGLPAPTKGLYKSPDMRADAPCCGGAPHLMNQARGSGSRLPYESLLARQEPCWAGNRGECLCRWKVAINGFGRIGRNILRAIVESGRTDIEVVAINDLGPVETNAHLLRFDSVHGRFPHTVTVSGDTIDAGRGPIKVTAIRDPATLPHGELGVDIALECTGIFTTRGQGRGASQSRRQARPRLGPGRRRRPHRRLRRQPRQAHPRPPRRVERLLSPRTVWRRSPRC